MARDIKMIWDSDFLKGDLEFQEGDLTREEGLTTAVLISLYTDARAREDDDIDNPNDKRGWWGDQVNESPIGSKLWQLERSKTTTETLVKTKQYILDALQWMIDDEVAQNIEVNVERFGTPGNDRLGFEVKIYQSDGNLTALKFDDLWKGEFNEL